MLQLDAVAHGVPDVHPVGAFYRCAFAPTVTDNGKSLDLDLHQTGHLTVHPVEASPPAAASPPLVLSYIVGQPGDVKTLLDRAVGAGATVLKPAKKMLFAGFSAVYQAPDGTVWKIAAASRKDTAAAANPPVPSEAITLLGVSDPQASKAFYSSLGMTVEHDYGNKFVDFQVASGAWRLALMQRKALAKDAGIDAGIDAGSDATVLHARLASRAQVDSALAAAAAAGGTITAPTPDDAQDGYRGYFADPDGFRWMLSAA